LAAACLAAVAWLPLDVCLWQNVLKKSFRGDGRNFSELLVRSCASARVQVEMIIKGAVIVIAAALYARKDDSSGH
jgi:hypothetical protein